MPHMPCMHVDVATLASEQAVAQAPQLLTSVTVLVSQPLVTIRSQSEKPVVQPAIAHMLMTQAAVAFGRLQLPQPPPEQAPCTHVCPVGQALPQAPQLFASVATSVSQPSWR